MELRTRGMVAMAAATALLMGGGQQMVSSGQSPAEARYVGHENCKMCHSDQHKKWVKSRHARAFDLLVATSKTDDPECLRCHTTGYGREGGYGSKSDLDLRGIQCEACHGPGSEHNGNKQKITRAASVTVCAACHLNTAIH